MRDYEIVGYVQDGQAYCLDCFLVEEGNPEQYPIFAGEEAVNGICCGCCVETILEALKEEEPEAEECIELPPRVLEDIKRLVERREHRQSQKEGG